MQWKEEKRAWTWLKIIIKQKPQNEKLEILHMQKTWCTQLKTSMNWY